MLFFKTDLFLFDRYECSSVCVHEHQHRRCLLTLEVGTGITGGCGLLCGCLEPNPSPLTLSSLTNRVISPAPKNNLMNNKYPNGKKHTRQPCMNLRQFLLQEGRTALSESSNELRTYESKYRRVFFAIMSEK